MMSLNPSKSFMAINCIYIYIYKYYSKAALLAWAWDPIEFAGPDSLLASLATILNGLAQYLAKGGKCIAICTLCTFTFESSPFICLYRYVKIWYFLVIPARSICKQAGQRCLSWPHHFYRSGLPSHLTIGVPALRLPEKTFGSHRWIGYIWCRVGAGPWVVWWLPFGSNIDTFLWVQIFISDFESPIDFHKPKQNRQRELPK